MQKLLVAALFLSVALSCKNDFDLTDKWQDIPVVYGFLNQKDTAHYVRVEKVFLDPKTSALVIAQVADSLYYKDAKVYLERGSDGKRFELARVDGAAEGHPREAGIFAQSPNILYKIKQSDIKFKPGETCKLILDRGAGLPLDTAVTTVLGDMELHSPFQNVTGMQFKTGEFFYLRFSAPPEAQIFDITATIRVTNQSATETTFDTLYWPVKRNFKRPDGPLTSDVQAKTPGLEFFKFIAANLPPRPGFDRYITSKSISFRIDGGGKEINDFNDAINANLGISGAELIPVYTNMSEGFGLFTSRGYIVETGFGLNPETQDSLKHGYLTKDLGFK